MQKRNPLQVTRFHRVNNVMNLKNWPYTKRREFVTRVLEVDKPIASCTAEELELLLIGLGENPNEEAQTA